MKIKAVVTAATLAATWIVLPASPASASHSDGDTRPCVTNAEYSLIRVDSGVSGAYAYDGMKLRRVRHIFDSRGTWEGFGVDGTGPGSVFNEYGWARCGGKGWVHLQVWRSPTFEWSHVNRVKAKRCVGIGVQCVSPGA